MLRLPLLIASAAILVAVTACAARSPEELFAAALTALEEGEARTAEIHLKNLLQLEPDHAEARALLGRVALSSGDAATAEHNLQRAIDLGLAAAPLQVPLLQSMLLQRKFEQVIERAAAELELSDADRASVLQIKGTAYRNLGALDQAQDAYRAALVLDPGSAPTRTALAEALFAGGDAAGAAALVAEVVADTPEFVPAILLEGSLHLAQGRFTEAEQRSERSLSLVDTSHPLALQALAQLAEAQLRQRKIEAAQATAGRLLGLAPANPVARHLAAQVDVERGDLDSAERRLESIVADTPEYGPAYTLLAVINARQNQLGQAEMYMRQAVNRNPDDPRTQLLLAEIYLRQNNVDGARDLLDATGSSSSGLFLALAARAALDSGNPTLAKEYFDLSEQRAPRTLEELTRIAAVYADAGELDRAVKMLESATFTESERQGVVDYLLTLVHMRRGDLGAAADAAAQLPERPDALNLRGTVALLSRDFAAAKQLYGRALELDPRYVPAMLNLAKVAYAEGDRSQAATHLRNTLEVDPAQINGLVGLTQLAVERGDFADAEHWVSRMPESVLRFRVEGQLLVAQRRFSEAVAALTRANELQPSADLAVQIYAAARAAGNEDADSVLREWDAQRPGDPQINFALGTVALEQGDHETSIRRFETVLAVTPNHAAALNNLAWLYGERGDERAIGYAERAFDLQPQNAAIADTLGWLHVRRGDAAAGKPYLERAAAASAEDPEIQYHYAVALAETGEVDRATMILAEIVAGAAPFPSKSEAQRRLAELRRGSSP